MNQFICETDLDDYLTFDEIEAAEKAGLLIAWRTDSDGRRWFKRIRAVPDDKRRRTIRGVSPNEGFDDDD